MISFLKKIIVKKKKKNLSRAIAKTTIKTGVKKNHHCHLFLACYMVNLLDIQWTKMKKLHHPRKLLRRKLIYSGYYLRSLGIYIDNVIWTQNGTWMKNGPTEEHFHGEPAPAGPSFCMAPAGTFSYTAPAGNFQTSKESAMGSKPDVYGPPFPLVSILACNGDWSSPECEDLSDLVLLGEAS